MCKYLATNHLLTEYGVQQFVIPFILVAGTYHKCNMQLTVRVFICTSSQRIPGVRLLLFVMQDFCQETSVITHNMDEAVV